MAPPIVYMIRHGEKPAKNTEGEDPPGLSGFGLDRSRELVQVFGPGSPYNIHYIIAQAPKGEVTGTDADEQLGQARPYLTVLPLAKKLGFYGTDMFNFEIKRDKAEKVAKAVQKYADHHGKGNILICWEHHNLTNLATALGIPGEPTYPDKRFDLIWTINSPYNQINNVSSELTSLDTKDYSNDLWAVINGVWTDGNFSLSPTQNQPKDADDG